MDMKKWQILSGILVVAVIGLLFLVAWQSLRLIEAQTALAEKENEATLYRGLNLALLSPAGTALLPEGMELIRYGDGPPINPAGITLSFSVGNPVEGLGINRILHVILLEDDNILMRIRLGEREPAIHLIFNKSRGIAKCLWGLPQTNPLTSDQIPAECVQSLR